MPMSSLFKILLSGIFVMVFHATPALAQARPKLAVLDIDARGEITNDQASVFTDIVRSHLVKSQRFEILERTHIEAVLKEQGFQMTQNCNSADCRIKVGQLLGVNGLVTGSMSRLGSLYTLSLRIVDVENGKVLRDEFQDCRCSLEDLATNHTPQMVARLIRLDGEKAPKPIKTEPEFKIPEFKLPEQPKTPDIKVDAQMIEKFRIYKHQEKSLLWGTVLNFGLPFGYMYLDEWGWFWGAAALQTLGALASVTYPYYVFGAGSVSLVGLLMPIHGFFIADAHNNELKKKLGLTEPQLRVLERQASTHPQEQHMSHTPTTMPLFQVKTNF